MGRESRASDERWLRLLSPRWRLVRMAWVTEASPRELIRDAVIFAVDMPNGPLATSFGQLLAQVIAFR